MDSFFNNFCWCTFLLGVLRRFLANVLDDVLPFYSEKDTQANVL